LNLEARDDFRYCHTLQYTEIYYELAIVLMSAVYFLGQAFVGVGSPV
jgi:hypothetical protein